MLDDDDAGAGGETGATGAVQGGGAGGPPAWAADLSGEAIGEGQHSNRDYVTAKNFKDPDTIVTAYRELEKQLHGGKGYVKVPGEGAKPEEVAAYRTALGVPEKAEDYEITLPEVGEGEAKLELDTGFLEPMRAAALEANIPKAAFARLGDAFIKFQLDQRATEMSENDAEREATLKDWGPEQAAKSADLRRGAKILGLNRDELNAWQNATLPDGTRIGARKVMEKLANLGAIAGEDVLSGKDGKTSFGVPDAAAAQEQIDAMLADKEISAKLSAKDPATLARYNRLNDAISHFNQRAAAKR